MRNGVMSFDEFCFDEFYKNTYECDPDKNTECTKESCFINGGECSRTMEKKYAREDKKILNYEDYEVKKVFDEDLKSEIKNIDFVVELKKHKISDKGITDLSNLYSVSKEAIMYKLYHMNYITSSEYNEMKEFFYGDAIRATSKKKR